MRQRSKRTSLKNYSPSPDLSLHSDSDSHVTLSVSTNFDEHRLILVASSSVDSDLRSLSEGQTRAISP